MPPSRHVTSSQPVNLLLSVWSWTEEVKQEGSDITRLMEADQAE